MDLLPTVASLYFQKRLGNDVRLSATQNSILLALGLQRKSIETVEVGTIPIPEAIAIEQCFADGTAASCLTNSGALYKDR